VPIAALVTAGFHWLPDGNLAWKVLRWSPLGAAAIIGVLQSLASVDLSRQLLKKEEYVAEGVSEGLRRWRVAGNLKAGAEKQLYRQLHSLVSQLRRGVPQQLTIGDTSGEQVIKALLNVLAEAVAAQLDMPVANVTCNLMLPEQKSRKGKVRLVTVAFGAESAYRQANRQLRVHKKSPAPGAASAYMTGEIQYIPDTHQVPGFDNSRPYRCVMSWPIKCGCGKYQLGVVNIDSENAADFGGETEEGNELRHATHMICSEILQSMAVSLIDPRCFPSVQRPSRR
jgi:hypothetical protein